MLEPIPLDRFFMLIAIVFSSYIILSPQRIRPDEDVQISVSILRMIYPQITLRLAIKKDVIEMISTSSTFLTPGTRILQMKVRYSAFH